MSVFDKDIIEREINFDPDPNKNMRFQIERKFNKLCDNYNPTQSIDIQTVLNDMMQFLKYEMSDFMEYLQMNTWQNTGDIILPPDWEGDFLYIVGYRVEIIKLTNGRSGVQVSWKYTNSTNIQSIDLCIDENIFLKKLHNKYIDIWQHSEEENPFI